MLWGCVKIRVVATLLQDINTLKVRITDDVGLRKNQCGGNRKIIEFAHSSDFEVLYLKLAEL